MNSNREAIEGRNTTIRATSATLRHRRTPRIRPAWSWILAALLLSGCSRIDLPHEESRMAIDALYTAVTSRRPELVETCENQLKELETAGKLPPSTASDLKRIIEQARAQQWQPAAEKLDALIRKIKP